MTSSIMIINHLRRQVVLHVTKAPARQLPTRKGCRHQLRDATRILPPAQHNLPTDLGIGGKRTYGTKWNKRRWSSDYCPSHLLIFLCNPGQQRVTVFDSRFGEYVYGSRPGRRGRLKGWLSHRSRKDAFCHYPWKSRISVIHVR